MFKSKLNLGNVCLHLALNLCKNVKIKIYKTINFSWVGSLVSHIKGRTKTEGVLDVSAEENMSPSL